MKTLSRVALLSTGHLFLRILFQLAVLGLLYSGWQKIQLEPHPALVQSLWKGETKGYTLLGSEFEPWKSILPGKGTITVLMDYPIGHKDFPVELYQNAQNYLAPLILNPYPKESTGFIYCSSDEIRDRRLQESGYRLAINLKNGKGIIVRQP